MSSSLIWFIFVIKFVAVVSVFVVNIVCVYEGLVLRWLLWIIYFWIFVNINVFKFNYRSVKVFSYSDSYSNFSFWISRAVLRVYKYVWNLFRIRRIDSLDGFRVFRVFVLVFILRKENGDYSLFRFFRR